MSRNNNRVRFQVGINLGISSAFVFLVVITAVALCFIIITNVKTILREDLRRQIHNTVATAALLINGDVHDTLRDPSQETGNDYKVIKAQLAAVRDNALLVRFVYTMRKESDGAIHFVVDAETDPKTMSHIEDVYDKPTPELVRSLEGNGSVQVETTPSSDEWGTWLSGFAPIRNSQGKLVGILGLDMSAADILKQENNTFAVLVTIATVVSLLVLGLGIFLSRRITTPLKALEQEMTKIQKFDIDGDVRIRSLFREIRRIAEVTENVKESLRSFKKYVPADLVARLVSSNQAAHLGGERRDLTIFFSDIENFTTWSENLQPEELISIMARYFSGMTEIIMRHQGTIDKYIGDSVMAFWGAPNELADHAILACRAALECMEFQKTLNAELALEKRGTLNTRIGLNSGEVLVGNVGYERRLNYTILGDHVNLASRLEGLNKYYHTNIIMSGDTAERIGSHFVTRILDKVVVKGKTRSIPIFELVAAQPAHSTIMQFTEKANRATSLYFDRKWQEALAAYQELLAQKPDDYVLRVMSERCAELLRKDPGPGWQGYIVLRDK